MRRYYFETESSAPDSVCNDHCGNIRGARTIAQKVANEFNETVYINDSETDDIVDCIEPDSILDEVSEHVENKTTFTYDEIVSLLVLVKDRISHNEDIISYHSSSRYSEASELISKCEKEINSDNIIVEKLHSLALEVFKIEK